MVTRNSPKTWEEIPFLDLIKAQKRLAEAFGSEAGSIIKLINESPDFVQKIAEFCKKEVNKLT